MDLFSHKRIRQLEEERDRLHANLRNESAHHMKAENDLANELAKSKNQVEYLVRTIRDMDQEIWNMAQKTEWAQQRPHFCKLHDEMIARKVAESARISTILRGELLDTYRPEQYTKRIK